MSVATRYIERADVVHSWWTDSTGLYGVYLSRLPTPQKSTMMALFAATPNETGWTNNTKEQALFRLQTGGLEMLNAACGLSDSPLFVVYGGEIMEVPCLVDVWVPPSSPCH